MPNAPDTFARFVGVVSSSLDEHDIRGDDLSARMYLSRAHLDRVMSATAGEPPGRFRRRVLLERAAYRLMTGRASVLDVAVEAGFSSHAAFTRAFRRNYGVAPSVWRRQPGPVALDSPNGVHFSPPNGLRLPAQERLTSMDLIISMTDHHLWLLTQLLDRAGRLDDRQLDRPIQISVDGIDPAPTIRSLLSRLVGQLDMWNAAVDNREYDLSVERDENVVSMRGRLDVAGATFRDNVAGVCAREALDEAFVDATSGAPLFFTYAGMVAHVLTYAAHRRTLVVGALSSAGVRDLEDDPLAWEPVRPIGPTAP